MKKLGIITLYGDYNIGNKLQNYAVQHYFESLGFVCETIPHWEMSGRERNYQNFKLWLKNNFFFPVEKREKYRLDKKRKKRFKQFSDRNLKLGKTVKIKKLPTNFSSQYDYFVVGSDQVWHNWTLTKEEIDYFFLKFANENQRITIAPSFGKNEIEKEYLNDYIEGIKGFKVLTCREEQGAKIIKRLTNRSTYVLLDPTMLIDDNQWVKIEKKPDRMTTKNYILVYALGKVDDKVKSFISNIAHKYVFEVIDILNVTKPDLYLTTPDEFLYYIRNAKLVVTDSFHACVFSILFHTNFVVFERETVSMGNMTSRIDTLLNRFGLVNRKLGKCEGSLFDTDFSSVSKILEDEREKACELYKKTIQMLKGDNGKINNVYD